MQFFRFHLKFFSNSSVLFKFLCVLVSICALLYNTFQIKKNDPDMYRTVCELARSKGFQCFEYSVITEDGYNLTLHRIRKEKYYKKSNPVVYMNHALLDAGSSFVINFESNSLGFYIANQGCDVFLGENRGNTYSRNHLNYTVKDEKFWDFSWDEMSKYDVPAFYKKMMQLTNKQQVVYIGHSEGTAIMFAALAEKNPILTKHTQLFIAMAPAVYILNLEYWNILKYVGMLTPSEFYFMFGKHSFLPNDAFFKKFVGPILCKKMPEVCEDVLLWAVGYDKENKNLTRFPVYYSHTPAGTSTRNMLHWSQMSTYQRFSKFDFGKKENLVRYGSVFPPIYNLTHISNDVNIAIFAGGKDNLARPKGVKKLVKEIQKNLVYYEMIDSYDHMDFVWGKDGRPYPKISDLIFKYWFGN